MDRLIVLITDGCAAAPLAPRLPGSLTRRADLLLRALSADLAAVPGIDVVAMASPDVATGVAAVSPHAVADGAAGYLVPHHATAAVSVAPDGQPCGPDVEACIDTVDAVWPLALESGGVLERLSHEVVHAGRILLGCPPGAVRSVSSKRQLARILADAGVAVAAAYGPNDHLPQPGGPWVVKPDDGAACLHTRLFSDRAGALAWIRARPLDGYVLQPFVAGKPASLSLLCHAGTACVLACNQERIAMRDNRFHPLGSVVNGLADDDGALGRLAQQVAAAIPALWGYVGINIVLTARGPVVLDVNPRLTTAYAGLRASLGCNPAGLVLDLLKEPAALPAPVLAGRRRAVGVDLGLA